MTERTCEPPKLDNNERYIIKGVLTLLVWTLAFVAMNLAAKLTLLKILQLPREVIYEIRVIPGFLIGLHIGTNWAMLTTMIFAVFLLVVLIIYILIDRMLKKKTELKKD